MRKIFTLTIVFFVIAISFCEGNRKLPEAHVKGWLLSGANPGSFVSGIDKSVSHSGSASAFVESRQKKGSEKWCTLMQVVKQGALTGKRIRFSAWVKTDAVNGWVGLWMRVDQKKANGEYGQVSFDNMVDRPIRGSTDWKQYEVVLKNDTAVDDIAFGVILTGCGKLWMDDVRIENINSAVSQTGWDANDVSSSQGILNLNFEKKSVVNTPLGWGGTMSNGYTILSDSAVFHEGKVSALVRSVEYNGKGKYYFGGITGGISGGSAKLDSFSGKRIRLSGWIKTEGVRDGGLWMRVDGYRAGEISAFDNMANRAIQGTSDWKKYEVVLDVAPSATNINFGALFVGEGKLWLDDIHFEIVGKDVASTSTFSSKGKRPHKKKRKKTAPDNSSWLHDLPVNLGFEE